MLEIIVTIDRGIIYPRRVWTRLVNNMVGLGILITVVLWWWRLWMWGIQITIIKTVCFLITITITLTLTLIATVEENYQITTMWTT